MPKLEFTAEELKGYFKHKVRHHFYEKTCKNACDIRVHARGEYPATLIDERRPNEPDEVKCYRKKIYIAKTKATIFKVFSSLSKIRRSSDWSIRYENLDEFSLIKDDENLEEYCEKNFPYFTSVTNWTFSVLLPKYLEDPNAVVLTMPLEMDVKENEHLRPFPKIFDAEDVLYYVDQDYAILRNPLGATYYAGRPRTPQKGDSFYVVTTLQLTRYDQVNAKGDMAATMEYEHGLGFCPVEKIKALVIDSEGIDFLYESRIAAMIPELDEAVREYSDLQAAKVLHIYPERWEFTQNECPTCKGKASLINPQWTEEDPMKFPPQIPCTNPRCHDGYIVAGPYSKILIRPTSGATELGTTIPSPPAGYVEKDSSIVKIQDEGVDKHLYDALAAINFQFLHDTPLNESGKAKEVDSNELNNTVNAIAEDIVRVIDVIYKTIAITRYRVLYSPEEIIEKMVPRINVPENYDLLSLSHLEDEMTAAKTNKVNPVILNAMEIEFASKKFTTDPRVGDELTLVLKLDPLPNVSEDEKMSRLSNKGITLETYIISSNIHEFVQQAIDDDKDFSDKELKEQKAVMKKYAQAQIKAAEEALQKATVDMSQGGLDEFNQPTDQPPVPGKPNPRFNEPAAA